VSPSEAERKKKRSKGGDFAARLAGKIGNRLLGENRIAKGRFQEEKRKLTSEEREETKKSRVFRPAGARHAWEPKKGDGGGNGREGKEGGARVSF